MSANLKEILETNKDILGDSYENLGKNYGCCKGRFYLSYDAKTEKWSLLTLNIFQRFLRLIGIAYRNTHLKHVHQEVTKIVAPNKPVLTRMQHLMNKTYFPEKPVNQLDEAATKQLEEDVSLLKKAFNQFQLDFSVQLNEAFPDKSSCFSPVSIFFILGILIRATDNGHKIAQFKEILGLNEMSNDRLHSAMRMMQNELNRPDKHYELNSANAAIVVGSTTERINSQFQGDLKKYYGGEAIAAPSNKVIPLVHQWVSEKTKGQIKELLKEGELQDGMGLLMNALYFKGQWKDLFEESNTHKRAFKGINGKEKEVLFMQKSGKHFSIYESETENVCTAFKEFRSQEGTNLKFMLCKPFKSEGTDDEWVTKTLKNLNPSQMAKKAHSDEGYNLIMPKMDLEYEFNVDNLLKAMGIDIDNLSAQRFLASSTLDQVIQKVKFNADEEGVTAAAVTHVIMKSIGEPKDFIFDQTFIYAVMKDDQILFQGVMKDTSHLTTT